MGCETKELESILAGVPRASDEALDAGHHAGSRVVVTETVDIGLGQGLEQLRRSRPLRRHEAGGVAAILQRGLETARGEQPAEMRDDRLAVGGVAHHQVALVDAVDDEVIDHAAIARAQHRILGLSGRKAARIGDHAMAQKGERIRAGDEQLAHVRQVEQSHGRSNGAVFVDDRGVLDRHLPTREGHHSRAERSVDVVERRVAQRPLGLRGGSAGVGGGGRGGRHRLRHALASCRTSTPAARSTTSRSVG